MIRSVDFISRLKAEALPERGDLAIISISEPEVDPAVLKLSEDMILRTVFHDVDPGNDTASSWMLFDESHARHVIDFVRRIHDDPRLFDLVIHCKAGISRSAALALFAADDTGCDFPRKLFAGLANKHILSTLQKLTGRALPRPRALPKRESFSISISRDFETGLAVVTVGNTRNGESFTVEGPMLDAPSLAAEGIERVWGILEPPLSYHVSDWDALT